MGLLRLLRLLAHRRRGGRVAGHSVEGVPPVAHVPTAGIRRVDHLPADVLRVGPVGQGGECLAPLDTAGPVAAFSRDRPSLYLVGAPERTPCVAEKDMRENGAIVMWPSADTAGTPPAEKGAEPAKPPETPEDKANDDLMKQLKK